MTNANDVPYAVDEILAGSWDRKLAKDLAWVTTYAFVATQAPRAAKSCKLAEWRAKPRTGQHQAVNRSSPGH
jgi:hypothetical protein